MHCTLMSLPHNKKFTASCSSSANFNVIVEEKIVSIHPMGQSTGLVAAFHSRNGHSVQAKIDLKRSSSTLTNPQLRLR